MIAKRGAHFSLVASYVRFPDRISPWTPILNYDVKPGLLRDFVAPGFLTDVFLQVNTVKKWIFC